MSFVIIRVIRIHGKDKIFMYLNYYAYLSSAKLVCEILVFLANLICTYVYMCISHRPFITLLLVLLIF
jgi:cadmium resistance protein CadD (predicted permease)